MAPATSKPYPALSLFFHAYGWLSLIFLLVGLASAGLGYPNWRQAQRLNSEGVEGLATITSREQSSGRGTSYHVSYRFPVADGRVVLARDAVSAAFYQQTRIGQSMPVRYAASDPAVSELEPGRKARLALIAALSAIGFSAVGTGGAVGHGRTVARAIRVRDHGVMRSARVTAVSPSNVRINKIPQLQIDWIDETGQTGHSMPMRPSKAEGFATGTPIIVYVDPADPSGSYWQGDVGARRPSAAPPQPTSPTVRRNR